MMVDKIYIEEKTFEDRAEFRVVIEGIYPKFLNRKGIYKRYASCWESRSYGGGFIDYVFIAQRKYSFLERFFLGKYYADQRRIAVKKCEYIIEGIKKSEEKPRITNYGR